MREAVNLVTSPFGIGEKLIFELLKKGESVYTVFPSPKGVPMSFIGKINLKYGFLRFDQDKPIDKMLPKKVKNVFHIYETYSGSYTKIFKTNPCATLILLDWAKNAGVDNFIYLSSGEVYGKGHSISESTGFDPRSFYATSKFETELLFRYFRGAFSLHTLRVFFPFGPDVSQGYMSDLGKVITTGRSVDTEYDIISPTFVDDIVGPLMKLRTMKGQEVFNICGSPVSIADLVDRIKYICAGSPKKINVGDLELTGNNTKSKELLEYRETPLNDAIKLSFSK
jgi:nucleoside-diphosphate-sugar epimerase